MKCLECGAKMKSGREDIRDHASGLPNVMLMGVEVRRCMKCGEEEVVIPNPEGLHRAIALHLIRKEGRLTGPEVRFLRKWLGWSGVDFARHFGMTKECVSRWENGHDGIGGTADRLLRLAVAHGKQVQDYPLDQLYRVKGDLHKPARIRVLRRPRKNVWSAVGA